MTTVLVALIGAAGIVVAAVYGPRSVGRSLIKQQEAAEERLIEREAKKAQAERIAEGERALQTLAVQRQAAETAARNEEALAEVARRQEQSVADAQNTAKETHEKLEVIRVDVNSNMTAAMQSELDAKLSELAARLEVIALKEQHGEKPSSDTLAAIQGLEEHIAELRAKLRDRHVTSEGRAEDAAQQVVDAIETQTSDLLDGMQKPSGEEAS